MEKRPISPEIDCARTLLKKKVNLHHAQAPSLSAFCGSGMAQLCFHFLALETPYI
jgi:hypothetical protein